MTAVEQPYPVGANLIDVVHFQLEVGFHEIHKAVVAFHLDGVFHRLEHTVFVDDVKRSIVGIVFADALSKGKHLGMAEVHVFQAEVAQAIASATAVIIVFLTAGTCQNKHHRDCKQL